MSDSAGAVESTPGFAEWTFPAEPGAVRAARTVVRRALEEWELRSVVDTTVLLVSELVTNALRYASGPIGVRMRYRFDPHEGPPVLIVEVSDPLSTPPRARNASPEDEGGRGLQLVARASSRWGTRRLTSGKTVWFELALPG